MVDCLKSLFPDFDFLFLFHHSQGLTRKKEGALGASKMNKTFGGTQPLMRNSKIEAVDGFIGLHEPRV